MKMTDKTKQDLENKLAEYTINHVKGKTKEELQRMVGVGVPEIIYGILKQLNILKIDPEKTRDMGYFHLDSIILNKMGAEKDYIYKLWFVVRTEIDYQIRNLSLNKYILSFFINGKGYEKATIYARNLDEAKYQLENKNIKNLLPATIEEIK